MSSHRKFSCSGFFSAFLSNETDLIELLAEFGFSAPSPFTTEEACNALIMSKPGQNDPLTTELYKLSDLATKKGAEIIKAVIEQFNIPGPHPDSTMTRERAALWLRKTNKGLFEHALDRLAIDGLQGTTMGLFQGRFAFPIQDAAVAVAGFEKKLTENLGNWKGAEAFNLRHYTDGNLLVILVFCERTAEVQLEMDSAKKVMTSIRRPVFQDVLFYNTATGELEIEAGQPSHREILRKSFALGVMGEDSFFPEEENCRVVQLQELLNRGFSLPTHGTHQAKITGIKVRRQIGKKYFTSEHSCSRTDLIEILGWGNTEEPNTGIGTVASVRIELELGTGRFDRKTIELSGTNRIKFNRSTHSETVYEYLRAWNLMLQSGLAEEDAA
jgi:hypothetical protein